MENKNKVYTIYVIKEDSTPCYIGVTSLPLKTRFINHCCNRGGNAKDIMSHVIAEKGRSHFSIEPLIQYFDKKSAYNAEAELTEIYRENYNLYNRNTGSKNSEESKQKLREFNLGKKLSEATKQKLREAHPKKKVFCVDLNKIYESINAASCELNIHKAGISGCCNGRWPSYKGYHFQFVS